MKKFFIQVFLLLFLIFGALFYFYRNSVTTLVPRSTQPTDQVIINNNTIDVQIADTQGERSKGLGGRESLASDSGMLFIFQDEEIQTFWMRGMNFPIDFIWIRDLKVVDLILNAPPQQPGQRDQDLPIYAPREPIDMVLEVNAGYVDLHGIKIGDSVQVK